MDFHYRLLNCSCRLIFGLSLQICTVASVSSLWLLPVRSVISDFSSTFPPRILQISRIRCPTGDRCLRCSSILVAKGRIVWSRVTFTIWKLPHHFGSQFKSKWGIEGNTHKLLTLKTLYIWKGQKSTRAFSFSPSCKYFRIIFLFILSDCHKIWRTD